MSGDVAESEALRKIEDQMRRMIDGDATPYDAGWIIWGTAMSVVTSPELMHPLWLIWGALTDWVELRPEESAQAEATMVRAAKEWLSIPSAESHARIAYLDRWVYDEMGYERPDAERGAAPDRPRD
jgi:hypothetical protein